MSKRIAQFGGIGGMSNQGAPGRSPIQFGNAGNNGKPNAIQPDVVFDSLLSPYQIGCDIERSIENQLEIFHTDMEADQIAYLDPKQRQKIKDGQYLQRRDEYRYKPLASDEKPRYPKFVPTETALYNKRVNDDARLNQDNVVEHIKPDRIHMSARKLNNDALRFIFADNKFEEDLDENFDNGVFGMNADGAEIARSPTSMGVEEDTNINNMKNEGQDKYHMDPASGGYNSPSAQYEKGGIGGRSQADIEHMLNDDKDVSVGGYGNKLPENGQFSTLYEGAAANYIQPDQYYKTDTEAKTSEPELDPQMKELLDGIMNNSEVTTESKLNLHNKVQNPSLQGPPTKDMDAGYSQYDALGNSKDNKFYQEAEGANTWKNNPGSIAQPSSPMP